MRHETGARSGAVAGVGAHANSFPPEPPSQQHAAGHASASVPALTIAALGIVFGDIGTSPLYALKECLSPHYGVGASRENVLGLLSLMTWSLTMVVTIKYLAFIMRATNRGEGGILSLLALTPERLRAAKPGRVSLVTALVIFGAALLYADGMITPAMSVLSAVEGLGVATHRFDEWVVPITCGILLGLFAVQRSGTARVGALFGPIMLLWFGVLAAIGVYHIAANPAVLEALSPHHAFRFLGAHGMVGFAVLGSVVLCVTGGEALYADMGHFGAKPIRIAWLGMVMPALLIAYFGQGANVLTRPEAAENPFFALVPPGLALYALVALATAAAVIASQALISGAYSLTYQAVHLGLFPRITVRHTSATTEGQIYVPEINWLLALACIALVLEFKSSSALAAAYGIAVCGTMAITSLMFALVARERWGWPAWKWAPLLALFLIFDLGFLAANLLKFMNGGYVPVVVAVGISLIMLTWTKGRAVLAEYYGRRTRTWEAFAAQLAGGQVSRPATVGVFMASDARGVPAMVLHQAERLRAIPGRVLMVTVRFERIPHVPSSERLVELVELGEGFHRVVVRFGFMDDPELPPSIEAAAKQLWPELGARDLTYYLGRESLVPGAGGKMQGLLENVFRALVRNALPATAYFRLPPEQVVEIGMQVDL